MAKVCLYCMEEYKNDEIMTSYKSSDNGLYQDCPRRACGGKVYNIDDNLVSTIIVLNSKGYPTYSSCAGHQLEVDTETYIEFSDDVKSLPSLPEGFKLRMKTAGDKTRLSIYRKSKTEDPVLQFSELLDFSEILYEWAIELDFNFDALDVLFVDLDGDSPFVPLLDISIVDNQEEEKKEKEPKKKLDVSKLKETAPKASIKLKRNEEKIDTKEKAKEEPKQEEVADKKDTKEEPKKEKPKKRGRPKKNPE